MNLIKSHDLTGLELWGEKDEKYFELRRKGHTLRAITDSKSKSINLYQTQVDNESKDHKAKP